MALPRGSCLISFILEDLYVDVVTCILRYTVKIPRQSYDNYIEKESNKLYLVVTQGSPIFHGSFG